MFTLSEHEKWMRRCLQLARRGEAEAPPNPLVGAVIVHEGRIIGEGFHLRCGEAHAEINALASVRAADRPLLRESTMYVNLEPCAHHGRTGPCAERLVREGIPRVFIGCIDPFAQVRGKGLRLLRDGGVQAVAGILEAECRELNRPFFVAQTCGRPFVTLKWAVSSDGFLDTCRTDGTPALLSTPHSLLRVHHLRARHQAILVGHRTLLLDRPQLSLRHWAGRSPLRCVLGNVPPAELPPGFEAFPDIDTLFRALQERGVQSLLVEGGRATLQGFIDRGLWDEAYEETAARRLDAGVPAPRMPHAPCTIDTVFGVPVRHWRADHLK